MLYNELKSFKKESQPSNEKFSFNKNIFVDIKKFKYQNSKNFEISNVKINISKGQKIGIIGPTASGKSTIVEIVTGILEPTEEELKLARTNNLLIGRRDALQKEFEEVMGQVDHKLPITIFDKDEVSSQISTLSSKIEGLQERLREIASENNKATQHNTRLEIIQEQTADFEGELEEIVEALGKVEDKSTHLEILKKAFSTNGLLAYKIENLVEAKKLKHIE